MATASEVELKLNLTPALDVAKLNVFLRELKASLGVLGKDIKLIDADKLRADLKKVTDVVSSVSDTAKKAGKDVGDELSKGTKKGADDATKNISKLKETLKEIGTTALGVMSGGLLAQGITGLVHNFEDLIESGGKYISQQEDLKLGFTQAGLEGEGLNKQMKDSNSIAQELSDKYAISASRIREVSASAALLTGSTGQNNKDMTELATGIEKMTHGYLSADMVVRVFGKNFADPETQVALGRLTQRFPQLAHVIRDIEDPTKAAQVALKSMAPAFDALAERAQGPEDAMQKTKNALEETKMSIGSLLIIGFAPLLQGAAALTHGLIPIAEFFKNNIETVGILTGTVVAYFAATKIGTVIQLAQAAATKLAALSQMNFNAVLMANPIGVTIAAVAALVVGLHALSSALHTTAADKQKDIDASIELNDKEKQATETKLDAVKQTNSLSQEYILLAKSLQQSGDKAADAGTKKKRLADISEELSKKYPGLSKGQIDYNINLAKVKDIAIESASGIRTYMKQVEALDKKAKELFLRSAQNQSNVAKENLESLFTDMFSNVSGAGWFSKWFNGGIEYVTGSSTPRKMAEEFVGQFSKGIYNAKSLEDLETAKLKYQDAILGSKLSETQQNEAIKGFDQFYEKQKVVLETRLGEAGKIEIAHVQTQAELIAVKKKELADLQNKRDTTPSSAGDAAFHAMDLQKQALEDEIKHLENSLTKDKATNEKTSYQIALDKYNVFEKLRASENEQAKNAHDLMIVDQKRSRNSQDDLIDAEKSLQLEKDKKEYYEQNVASVKNLNKENAQTNAEQLRAIDSLNQKATLAVQTITLRINLDESQLNTEKHKLEMDQLKFNIEIGIASPAALIPVLEKDLKTIRDKIVNANAEEKITLQQQELELQREIFSSKKSEYDFEVELLTKKQEKQDEAITKRLDSEKTLLEKLRKFEEDSLTKGVDRDKDAALKKLELQKKNEVITEDQYNRAKEKLDADSATRTALIKERIHGQELAAQQTRDVADLNRQKQKLVEELKIATENGQTKRAGEIITQLDAITKSISEKGDIAVIAAQAMSDGVNEAIGNLFNLDPEGVRGPLKKVMAVIAGALQQMLSAAVLQLLLTPGTLMTLNALPFPFNIIALPAIKATIQGAMNALTAPFINQLLSFGSGARVDQPTIAMIGDAAQAGGPSNREWVTGDDQMQMIIEKAISMYQSASVAMLQSIDEKLGILTTERLAAQGEDLMYVYERTRANYNSRIRG